MRKAIMAALLLPICTVAAAKRYDRPPPRIERALPSLPEPAHDAAPYLDLSADTIAIGYDGRDDKWTASAGYGEDGVSAVNGEYGLRLGSRVAAGALFRADEWQQEAIFNQAITFGRRTQLRWTSSRLTESTGGDYASRRGAQSSHLLEIQRWQSSSREGPAIGLGVYHSRASMPRTFDAFADGEDAVSSPTLSGYTLSIALPQLRLTLGRESLRELKGPSGISERSGRKAQLELSEKVGSCGTVHATAASGSDAWSAALGYRRNALSIELGAAADAAYSQVSLFLTYAIPLSGTPAAPPCGAATVSAYSRPSVVDDVIRRPDLLPSALSSSE